MDLEQLCCAETKEPHVQLGDPPLHKSGHISRPTKWISTNLVPLERGDSHKSRDTKIVQIGQVEVGKNRPQRSPIFALNLREDRTLQQWPGLAKHLES